MGIPEDTPVQTADVEENSDPEKTERSLVEEPAPEQASSQQLQSSGTDFLRSDPEVLEQKHIDAMPDTVDSDHDFGEVASTLEPTQLEQTQAPETVANSPLQPTQLEETQSPDTVANSPLQPTQPKEAQAPDVANSQLQPTQLEQDQPPETVANDACQSSEGACDVAATVGEPPVLLHSDSFAEMPNQQLQEDEPRPIPKHRESSGEPQEQPDIDSSSIEHEDTNAIVTAEVVESISVEASELQANPSNASMLRMVEPLPPLPVAEPTNYSEGLFVGKIMAMKHKYVIALSSELVVMCYTSEEVGGACHAAPVGANFHSDAEAGGSKLLPALAWGSPEVFFGNQTGPMEVVRLSPTRFAVCFERVSDSSVLCFAGTVSVGDGSAGFRCAFSSHVTLGIGRLISTTPASAGKKIAACFAEKEDRGVACRWGSVEPGSQDALELRWTDPASPVQRL
jgi:hypothetical protein